MLQPFRLEEPTSVPEASALLARYEDSAKLYAGGTELLLVMKEGLLHYDHLINIKLIPELDDLAMRMACSILGPRRPTASWSSHRSCKRISRLWLKLRPMSPMSECAKWEPWPATCVLPSRMPTLGRCCKFTMPR